MQLLHSKAWTLCEMSCSCTSASVDFLRLRARQSCMNRMAMKIAYKKKLYKPNNSHLCDKAKRRESAEMFYKDHKRVVFFGFAQFWHGRRDPCMLKMNLRALAQVCTVILKDEFRTSWCCRCCGLKMVPTDEPRS